MTHRVLLVDFAPSPGGSIVSLYYLVKGLREGGYTPLVLLSATNPYVPRFRALGVDVLTMDVRQGRGDVYAAPVQKARGSAMASWIRRTRPLAAIWHSGGFWLRLVRRMLPEAREVARLARAHQVNLVHCNDAVSISRIGILGARLAGLPCVCHARRFDRLGRFERWLAGSVDYFVFISAALEQHFLAQTRPAPPHRVIHNGLDLEDFPVRLDGRVARQEFGLSSDRIVIGIVGRLVGWKGHDVFLRGLERVAERYPEVQGLIVGGPEVNSPHLPQQLRQQADSLGLSDIVHFTGHREDIAASIAAMDILVHASTEPEPFGRVLIEGMAMSKPVVASAAGGVPEIVVDGVTGLLVRPGDAAALSDALMSLVQDPQRAEALGRAGRSRVEALFTIQHHVQRVQEVYGVTLGDR